MSKMRSKWPGKQEFAYKQQAHFVIACVAGGMRERASGGRAAIFLSGEARE